VHDFDRGSWNPVTFGNRNERPIWSTDGRRIFFASDHQIFSTLADGTGQPEQITRGHADRLPTSLSRDGRFLVFQERGDDGSWDVGMLRLDAESEPEMLLSSSHDEHTGMISPDSRWLAYVSNESERDEVYVASFPDAGTKWPISTDGGAEPIWSHDGKELFYRNGERRMVVTVSTEPDFAPGRPTLLFEAGYSGSWITPCSNYDVAAAGERFVMMRGAESRGAARLNVVLNWHQELLERVPVP
jgi:dipeptidyl aminopeptidase/acylaminoacyl peptidase